jgi:HEPN domain-containing protein
MISIIARYTLVVNRVRPCSRVDILTGSIRRAQQAGEKALKALCFARGFDVVRTHSLFQLVRDLKENGEAEGCARELDLYYVSGRYPDAFPGGAPYELITEQQSDRALEAARVLLDFVRQRLESA